MERAFPGTEQRTDRHGTTSSTCRSPLSEESVTRAPNCRLDWLKPLPVAISAANLEICCRKNARFEIGIAPDFAPSKRFPGSWGLPEVLSERWHPS